MATTASPYGLKPVCMIGGTPYSGSTRAIKIASGYTSNIYNGSVVKISTDGVLELLITQTGAAASAFPAGTIGVFVGCQYTDATMGFVSRNYWPTGQVAADAVGFVVDDPNVVFQAQAAGAITQDDLGQNAYFNAAQTTNSGSTATGNSNTALSATTEATTGSAFRIIGFVEGPLSAVGDAYTDVLVKFNNGAHSYTNPLGI